MLSSNFKEMETLTTLHTDQHFLKTMAEAYAVIDASDGRDLCAVYAQGDRRRRPMAWLPKADFDALYQNGHLKPVRKGYAFTYAAERKLIEGGWSLSADIHVKHMSDETIYVPGGVQRRIRKREGGYILKRLAKERGSHYEAFLSPHEIQAGELFQRDYAACFGYGVGRRSFVSLHVDQSRRNREELRTAAHIDESQAFNKAKAVLGAGLEQAALVICGEGKSLDVLEREQNWSRGSGRMILKLALQRLAEYYGTCPGKAAQRAKETFMRLV